jgi:hypothetical protein
MAHRSFGIGPRLLNLLTGTGLVASFFAALLAALIVFPSIVQASHDPLKHAKGTYPSHGFLWLDDLKGSGSGNTLWVYSDRCKSAEASTWSALRSQLSGGAAEFRGAWPGGIEFLKAACTSTADQFTDVMLDYMTASQWTAAGHGSYGGHHHVSLGDSSWCQVMGASYPCGYHISRLHINEPRFDNYASSYKVLFLTHETAHSMGFFDYCGHTSVANNDLYCPFHATWHSVDKQMLRNVIYKNSPVHW